ncbi:LOW QUALITY PROTEIN: nucleoprotein TPR [Thalassophryne amazonica]|uniref:LOW QUALITY PROTEIN: nucleoprotein TPR n=1 Tax=Thalassophryne amazonica TaxID=390379 RepID=UPI001471874D|nr:LOW QUALITY PROTEIN: nucleoprotein TPR [Thalassophryne amazonica]
MAAVLLQVLERTELNKLPKGAQNKLEKFITDLQNTNDALRTQHERFKADCEQQYFDIEKRLAESQEQILSTTKELQALKEENKKLNEELSTLKGIEGDISEDKSQQVKSKYEIEAEKREVARLLEKRTQEVENLTEDVKHLSEKLMDANKVKLELQLKLDDIQSSETSVQHQEKRMEKEKELLEKKVEWLTAELKTKTEELLSTNRENGKQILELQCSLKNSKEQVTTFESHIASLKETSESQTKRAEDLNNKLKRAKDEQNAMEEKYRNELNAHIKLSSLYKGAATDFENKNQELSRAVEELTKLVKDTTEANKMIEKKMSESEEGRTQLEADLREKIKKMEKELENATVKAAGKHCCVPSLTEEQLESMCPSASAIAAVVKPGMKFFDLYNAFAECQTQLQLEKQETKRVSRVLDEIVQEVESKAPVLKRQREEYESMQRSMASLCNKLEQARMEIYSLQKEREETKQRSDVLEREKLRTERLLEDTSSQLCSLLVEGGGSRGRKVTTEDGSSTDISSTLRHLSTPSLLRSVEELQKQNQNMLGRLEGARGGKSKQQSQITSARISELEASVDKLQKEVEQLKEQRNQQKQLSDSNARQRDMYKALLTQSTGFSLPPQGPESSSQPVLLSSVPATRSVPQRAAAAESAQAKAALKQLNDAFTLYKKEKAENDKILNDTNDRLQKKLTDLGSSKVKLMSQLEFINKRYEMVQETVSAFRREISMLQERNQKMAATTQRHEHIIHTMSQDLRQANEKLALEEVRVENLTKERDMLRQAESRLNREKEAMMAEQRNQNLLLSNLKTIQLTMERTETESRHRLNNKIEGLEKELVAMKTRLDKEIAQRHALGRTMDAQLLEAKKQLEAQNTLHQKTRELLRSSEQQVSLLKTQLASATSDTVTTTSSGTTPVTRASSLRAPLRVRSPVPPASQQPSQSDQELAEVKSLLHIAEEQKGELAEQLKNANAIVEQYRAVVLTLEDSLKKEKESRSPLEIRLKESEDVQKQLENRILEVEKMKQQEQEERRVAMETVEKQICELQRNLKASQTQQQEALERASAAVTMEQKAIQESLLQTKVAEEAQAKYERELMLHAADVEVLQEMKKNSQQEATHKKELEEQLSKTSSLLQEKTAVWTTVETQLKDELSKQTFRCEELVKQNSLLHQQMDEMATRIRQLQPQQDQQQLDLSFTEEGKTTEQLLEIIRFVRREKEIAMVQCEAFEGEALRCKQWMEHQEQELKELQEALNSERQKTQVTAKTLAQQEEQLKKMESISALQENIRILKMDREKLEQELHQSQAKVTKLQSDISPLHHSLTQLSERNGSLQADKRLLEEDVKHWKGKAEQLNSKQKDGDVEEKQKITAEREVQQKRITQLCEETAKLKTELARSTASTNSAQSQLQALRDSVARLTSERDTLKKDLETKNNELMEKNKTITQVKKIGRRYKTQYEEVKAQHEKLVTERTAKSAAESQEVQQELGQAQEELSKTKEELTRLREEVQKKQEEAQKTQQMLEEAQKEHQQTKAKFQEVQMQLVQNQNQLTQVQAQLSQSQTQLQQNQNQLTQSQKDLQQAKTHMQQLQNQLKSAQSQTQARQNQIQQIQKELQETKETLQQNIANQKELQQTQQANQQSHNQEVATLKTALSQAESMVAELQGQLDILQKTVGDRETSITHLEEQLTEAKQTIEASQASQSSQSVQASDANLGNEASQALQEELAKLKQELSESTNREEKLKLQMADKEEKTRKAILGAKTKISLLNSAKEKLCQEIEELKQSKEEQEVKLNALKSQYEGRLLRLDRELKDLRESQAHSDTKEEPQDQSLSKVGEQARSADQRQISLKSPAQDRGSSTLSDPPTANIRPTPSTPSPSNKPSPSPGSKATPRASIRPMVTPATVSMSTPTATVMPTTQTDNQDVLISAGAAVHSTSSSLVSTQTSVSQPSSTQATAFVQPTQQQTASQDAERPSTSSSLIGSASSKRSRDEDEVEESRPESSQPSLQSKKIRLRSTFALQVEDDEMEGEIKDEGEIQVSSDVSQELPEEGLPVLAEDDEDIKEESVSQSVPADQTTPHTSSQERDVIVIDTDSESRESKEGEEKKVDEGEEEDEDEDVEYKEEEYDEDDEDAADSGIRGEESNEDSKEAEEEASEATNDEENLCGSSSDSQQPSEPSHSSEGGNSTTAEPDPPRDVQFPTTFSSASSSVTLRLPQPRRPPHPLPPRLYIQPPTAELGPPHTQRQVSQLRRPSVGRGPQLTPGISTMQHFFDDDDRMVPSTPTLFVPHRNDGFAEAIHSPQVAGLSTRFRFGPPEDLLQQTPSSHSDLGQLASQGGLGMYESPLFLAAHEEDGGGRSVPTTPLQVAAPVTVFTESLPSDNTDNMASQSVPMATTSTGMGTATDDGDEVFMEHEGDGPGIESSLESQADTDSAGPQSDDASLPSTSQDPDTSSVAQRRPLSSQPLSSSLVVRVARGGRGEPRTTLNRRGTFFRSGRGGAMGRGSGPQ